MDSDETEKLAHATGKRKGNIYKRAKRRVKKAAGLGEKNKAVDRRPSTNPVSLAASEALYATKKTLRLSVRFFTMPLCNAGTENESSMVHVHWQTHLHDPIRKCL